MTLYTTPISTPILMGIIVIISLISGLSLFYFSNDDAKNKEKELNTGKPTKTIKLIL